MQQKHVAPGRSFAQTQRGCGLRARNSSQVTPFSRDICRADTGRQGKKHSRLSLQCAGNKVHEDAGTTLVEYRWSTRSQRTDTCRLTPAKNTTCKIRGKKQQEDDVLYYALLSWISTFRWDAGYLPSTPNVARQGVYGLIMLLTSPNTWPRLLRCDVNMAGTMLQTSAKTQDRGLCYRLMSSLRDDRMRWCLPTEVAPASEWSVAVFGVVIWPSLPSGSLQEILECNQEGTP